MSPAARDVKSSRFDNDIIAYDDKNYHPKCPPSSHINQEDIHRDWYLKSRRYLSKYACASLQYKSMPAFVIFCIPSIRQCTSQFQNSLFLAKKFNFRKL